MALQVGEEIGALLIGATLIVLVRVRGEVILVLGVGIRVGTILV